MLEGFCPHIKKSTNFTLEIFGLRQGMKSMILKGFCIGKEKNDRQKEITVQNRFQIFKVAGTATQPPAVVPEKRAVKSWFHCPVVETQLISVHLPIFKQI